MAIYIIGDLHLSFSQNKPMSIFGDIWKNHEEKIKENWMKNVKENDTVILAGDFSWATYIQDTIKDFEYLNSLSGKKIFLKGNHDYWWETVTKMKKFLVENNIENIEFLYNNAHICDKYIFAGARGYSKSGDKEDEKIFKRELLRLELSLEEARKINENLEEKKEIVAIMHYPPITDIREKNTNEFIKLMKKYGIKKCFYGHLHGPSIKFAIQGNVNDIELKLISADSMNFELYKICD